MRINHNLMAMNANRYLSSTGSKQARSLEKISSGLRINSASDDAAGLAISEKMRAQISGLDQATNNAQDGISMIQTAEGALSETQSILQRMRELAVQSSNDTNTTSERGEMQKEVDELAKEITRISNNTEFNSQKLTNGGMQSDNIGAIKFHIGANAGQDVSLELNAMDAESLGVARDNTTATGTSGGDIDTATFSGTLGAGVVDGATVTATYTAAVAHEDAVDAVFGSSTAGAAVDDSIDLSGVAGSSVVVNVGGTDYTLDNAAVAAIGDPANADAVATALGAAESAGNVALSTVADVTINGDGKLEITAKTAATGTDVSVSFTEDTTPSTKLADAFGFTTEVTEAGVTAEAEVEAVSAKVTLTNGGTTQDVDVTSTDTTLSVTTGTYKGMSLTMDSGKTVANMADGDADTVTIAVTGTIAAAATFADGALADEAVTEAGIDISTQDAASAAITSLDTAITNVSAERSKLGAFQNRLEHTINNLTTTSENVQASESRIRDVDIADEMMNYTKLNILQQAAQSMLAQANQAPQGVLKLLG